jgi:DNA repair protein RadC
LSDITYETLVAMKGIGRVKAITLLCAVELGKRITLSRLESKLCFTNSASVAGYYQEVMRLYKREHVILLLLDTKGNLIKEVELSVGTINASLVSTRELLVEALKYNAVSVILLHNHPSGDATPSREDIAVTSQVQAACQTVGIRFLDHIVIGSKTYVGIITGGYIPSEMELF